MMINPFKCTHTKNVSKEIGKQEKYKATTIGT
jgi:hypothetical protein